MEGRRYPREFLVTEIKRVARIVGGMPTVHEFDQHGDVASATLVKRFKTWKNALASAGFDSSKMRTKYDDQELKEELNRVARELGHTPSTTEFGERSPLGASGVSRRLGGSWASACRSAGLPPPIIEKALHFQPG